MASQVKERLTVRGAHCENCLATIERALESIDGVTKVDAQLVPQASVVIEYDPEKVNHDALRRAVERVGYELVTQ